MWAVEIIELGYDPVMMFFVFGSTLTSQVWRATQGHAGPALGARSVPQQRTKLLTVCLLVKCCLSSSSVVRAGGGWRERLTGLPRTGSAGLTDGRRFFT